MRQTIFGRSSPDEPWIRPAVLWVLLLLIVEAVLVLTIAIEPRTTVGLVGALAGALLVLERPLVGVVLLIAARLLSTGALVFVRIGKMGIGPFEPVLLLCLGALTFYAIFHRTRIWAAFPWKAPFLALVALTGVSIFWNTNSKDAITELIPMALIMANALVILTFVRTWQDLRLVLLAWVGTCILVGILNQFSSQLTFLDTASFKAAEGGGRSTGLGQQPNWYAMNLMFIIPTTFGLALVERARWLRISLIIAGAWIFYSMLQSGSRGGAYATMIGGVLVSFAHPSFRKWFSRLGVATVIGGGFIVLSDLSAAKAITRVTSNALVLTQNYRFWNWEVCWNMFQDTFGLGIGAGGYEDLLPSYNYYVSQSLYDYPHGIFWQMLAHFGLPGLVILAWLILTIFWMSREVIRLTKGTVAEIIAWTMPAAMLAYFAWSFVEFTISDKPFWEFLTLYTVLYLLAKRAEKGEITIPAWDRRTDFLRARPATQP